MIINFFEKILEAASYFCILIVKILLAFSALVIIFNNDDDWNPVLFAASIFLVFVVKKIVKPRPQKLDIKNFMFGKPERDGIRYLRGKRAKEYEIAWENTNTYLEISNFNKFFLNIRLFFMEFAGLHVYYFHERHKYNAYERRLMDLFAVACYERDEEKDPPVEYSAMHKFRIKYIKFKYRKEKRRKEYWIRIWGKTKRLVYVWHEDFEKYKKLYWKRTRTKKMT